MPVRFLVTGGTFDKEYNELTGELFFKHTHLPEMLALGRARVPVEVTVLMMIDSLQMTADHRAQVAQACLEAPEERIVVTHGTDTMVETAKVLAERVPGKTIVLTGAMVPWKFGSSDGLFNLGSALAFAQVLPHGVYVSMNGRSFPWNDVRKNRAKGEFENL
jgi:L-asparaginase